MVRDTNDWLFLNNLIYKIYSIEDLDEMRYQFLEQLKIITDFDSADFYLADRDDQGEVCLGFPIGYNCNTQDSVKYDSVDYSRGLLYGGRSMVYRETDIISDERRMGTEYYKNVYLPNKWHYAMQMVFAKDQKFCGSVTLYRNRGRENYSYDDVMTLDMLKAHMSLRLFQEMKKRDVLDKKMSVEEAARQYRLTKREEEIVRNLLAGKDNAEISTELVISSNTLKKHMDNIYKKMGINKRNQLLTKIGVN